MRRSNTWKDAKESGLAKLEIGDGLVCELPLGKTFVISESAGRTISIWDDVKKRSQLISGRTGIRDVTTSLTAGKGYTVTYLELSRSDSKVTLNVGGLTGGTGSFLVIPSGFRPHDAVGRNVGLILGSLGDVLRINGSTSGINIPGNAANSIYTGVATWDTNDAWPNSLPGVAIGTIP